MAESAALAARHGFGGVDLPRQELQTPDDAAKARDIAAEHGIQWSFLWSPVDVFTESEETYKEGVDAFAVLAPLMEAAGCRRTYNHVWPGHDTREYKENFDFHVRRLEPVARIAADHRLLFGIEFIGTKTIRVRHRYPFLYTIDRAMDLILAAGDGAGLVLDTFHWHNSGGSVDDLRKHLHRAPIVNVHCNDAPAGASPDTVQDHDRAMPGETGVIDIYGVISLLREIDYDGPLMAEPFEPWRSRLATMRPDQAAAEVHRWMKPLIEG